MTADNILPSTTSLGLTPEGPSTGAPQPLTSTPPTTLGKRRRGESNAAATAIPQNPPSSVHSAAPPSHALNTSSSLGYQRPVWLRDVISYIKRHEGNIESKVVNAGAKEDVKDALTDGFMVLLFIGAYMNSPTESEELDNFAKVFDDGRTSRLHALSRDRVLRVSPLIMGYLHGIQEVAGFEMTEQMKQEVLDITLAKIEAQRKAKEERDNVNRRASEQPPSGVDGAPNDTGDGTHRANHPGAESGDAVRPQGPQANVTSPGYVTGQLRYLDGDEQEAHALQEHRRRVEDGAQRVEAQAQKVATHGSRIAEYNRKIAERDRAIAEEKMVEQARKEADREWVESMTELMQGGASGHPHSYNYAPEFQSVYANAPPQVPYGHHPQPGYYGQVPPGYAQPVEPQPVHAPRPQVVYYTPAAQGSGVPPPTYCYYYPPGPLLTSREAEARQLLIAGLLETLGNRSSGPSAPG
ncbi:hypothetical protein EYR40_002419 [Pleurotus pulmonarius]|nr:hypothetical protein EYR40_002419 [Pleurotus pulmonarius]